jgi:hypothetical protein
MGGMDFVTSNVDLILLFALIGSLPGAIVCGFAAGRRGAALGAIGGAILGPLFWIAGIAPALARRVRAAPFGAPYLSTDARPAAGC